jgi:hypothetical protein
MKEQLYYILENLVFMRPRSRTIIGRATTLSILFWIIASTFPLQTKAQDGVDSVEIFTDSGYTSGIDNEYQNKAGKFSGEAVFRSVPDTTVARLKKEKEFAYANDPAYWVKEKKAYKKGFLDYVFDFFQSDLVRWLFYIFLAGLVIFVLYRIIIVNDLFIFNSSKKNKRSLEDAALTEIDPSIIDQKIHEAIDQKKYNAAVRYLYIKTLYALNDKKWIQFHAQATNNEYLKQMSQHKGINDFRFLTQVYEYVWYGRFEVTEQQFSVVHHSFQKFQATI